MLGLGKGARGNSQGGSRRAARLDRALGLVGRVLKGKWRLDEVLGIGGAAIRPVLGSLAGEQALATFDSLARRTKTPADAAAREVFAGRVAFYLTDHGAGEYRWIFGVQADDARCERVLKMLGGRMTAPQRFASAAERLVFRRIGGWPAGWFKGDIDEIRLYNRSLPQREQPPSLP